MDSVYLASGGAQLEVAKQRMQQEESRGNLALGNRQQALAERRNFMDEAQGRQQLEANAFKLEMARQEEVRRKQQAAIAKMVFESNSGLQLNAESEDDTTLLAKNYAEMAKKLAGVDPAESNKFFKLSLETKQQAQTSAINSLKVREAKIQAQGDVALGVTDQESANRGVVEMAKLGKKVPEEAMDWNNPAAAQWWKRQAQFSETSQKLNRLDIDNKELLVKQDTLAFNKEKEATANNLKERKLEMAREKIKSVQTNKLTKPDEKALKGTISYMAENYEAFDGMAKEDQRNAAEDIDALALQYMKEKGWSQPEAKKTAQDQVASMIVDGKYTASNKAVKETPAGKFVEGKVYTDKNGNKAKYSNGKWIAQ